MHPFFLSDRVVLSRQQPFGKQVRDGRPEQDLIQPHVSKQSPTNTIMTLHRTSTATPTLKETQEFQKTRSDGRDNDVFS